MINLSIGNSECTAAGLTKEQWTKLRDMMSYSISDRRAYFSKSYFNQKRFLIDKAGRFPTGLLYIFDAIAKSYNWPCTRLDNRRLPMPLGRDLRLTLPFPPYEHQKLAVEAARASGRGIIVAPTGSGKSIIIAMLIKAMECKTLVVVPSLELKTQLTKTLQSMFLVENSNSYFDQYVTVENVDSLDTTYVTDYGCVIIDEFHHSGAATYQKLNKVAWKNTYYKFGLTATPFRSKDNERLLLESVLSEVIFNLPYKTAVSSCHIVPLEAYTIPLAKVKYNDTKSTWGAVYSTHIVHREDRNQKIIDFAINVGHDKQRSVLILVKQIKHGEILQQMLYDRGVDSSFANGEDSNSNDFIYKFSLGKTRILIASSIVGEGVDTRAAEYIVLAGGVGKSKIAIMQNCGRSLRIYTDKLHGEKQSGKVIIFDDNNHRWFRDHNRFFLQVMQEEYNIVPEVLDI